MDAYQTALTIFLQEIKGANIQLSQEELSRIQKAYNVPAVQLYINTDIERAKNSAAYYERDRVAREKELYHSENIKNIARTIARRVILEKRERPFQMITESKSLEFRGFVKTAGARGCDMYPCEAR